MSTIKARVKNRRRADDPEVHRLQTAFAGNMCGVVAIYRILRCRGLNIESFISLIQSFVSYGEDINTIILNGGFTEDQLMELWDLVTCSIGLTARLLVVTSIDGIKIAIGNRHPDRITGLFCAVIHTRNPNHWSPVSSIKTAIQTLDSIDGSPYNGVIGIHRDEGDKTFIFKALRKGQMA